MSAARRTAKMDWVDGLNGANLFRFEGSLTSKRGVEHIGIEVEPIVVKNLAHAMQHTDSVGHAAYHVQHPDLKLPCSSCEKVSA